MDKRREFWRNFIIQVVILGLLSYPLLAKTKNPLPAEVFAAKSIYLENETGDQHVLDTASDQFKTWGRFAVAASKDDAAIVAVFRHHYGLDKFGNASFIEMDIFVKGNNEPVYVAENAWKLITAPEYRTKACIADFKKTLESGSRP